MKYVGIDLGTTNSAICSFDGESVRLYKSPEQHDVTPSAIFFERRGKKYVGSRAYNNAARSPDNAAVLFKRLMGTSTPVEIPAVEKIFTPEECSSEILRALFGYLPEEFRAGGDTGTVITVPAAFNQMQKEATMVAAECAGIGRVALMQEPVAAVMSVMRMRKTDGVFLIYDIGGGTLDVAIAHNVSGRVNLLTHGGIEMCGGRDFDRVLFDNVVIPWLFEHFDLPEDLLKYPEYKSLRRMATWAVENAKIELSQRDSTTISLSEVDIGARDQSGEEIYIDVDLTRDHYDSLILPKLQESIEATRKIVKEAGLTSDDIERIVFIGGPAQYKPLRDKVSFELAISASTEVNPMTAVAEGAAVFSESIDWQSNRRGRKSTRESINSAKHLDLKFNYTARTPGMIAKVVAKTSSENIDGVEFQIDSLDTGWSSGRIQLTDGASVDLSLSKPIQNIFKIFVFGPDGSLISLEKDRIEISRSSASVEAIPASHSIAFEALEKIGGSSTLIYIAKKGDRLPRKGTETFKALESLRSGSQNSINFKIWEGDIKNPIADNNFVGVFKICGDDFDDGVIAAGDDLICNYEVLDSGTIYLNVEVPSIGADFKSNRNFYSSQEGKIDYSQHAKRINDQASEILERVSDVSNLVTDDRLEKARDRLDHAANIENDADPEAAKQAMDNLREAKSLLAQARSDHQKEIRHFELDGAEEFFESMVRDLARPTEISTFENLTRSARRAIEKNSDDFDGIIDDIRARNYEILLRHDGYVIEHFKFMSHNSHLFPDQKEHARLTAEGTTALQSDDFDQLREILYKMQIARIDSGAEQDMLANVNILRGS